MASVLTDDAFEPPDDELLRLVREGDRDALVTLYHRYQDMVYGFALHMTGTEAIAEDVTQDTFLALTRGVHYNAGDAKFSTYLYGIVRRLTKRRTRHDFVFLTLTGKIADRWQAREPLVEQSLVEAVSKQQTIERVRRAVLSLPRRYREVVVLCDLHGRDYVEAAAIVGCAVGTVRSRLHRARDLLRRKLECSSEVPKVERQVGTT